MFRRLLVVLLVAAAIAGPAPEPVVAAGVAADVRVPVSVDTYVVQEAPTTVFGAATKLAASHWSTPWHSQVFLRFSVPAPPAGQRLSAARLELTFQKLTQQPAEIRVSAVASTTWAESITYQTRPAIGALLSTAAIAGQGTPAVTASLPVTAAATGLRSFAVTNPTAESAAVFHSREAGTGVPALVLTYTPATQTLCGASFAREGTETWPQALARDDALFNGLEAVRFFHGGLPAAWPGPLDVGQRTFVVSFKGHPRDHTAGTHDARMRQWFADAPRDRDIYWIYFHEPENDIAGGAYTAAEYRAAFRHLKALADTAGNPRLHPTLVLMQWTVEPASGRNWRDYYPGDGVVDVFAWDVYNFDSSAAQGRYVPPATLLDAALAVNAGLGLPTGIAEMGSHIAAGDDGTRRAAWIQAMNDYLRAHGSLWNLWFDLDWSNGDYRLRDPAALAAWQQFCDS